MMKILKSIIVAALSVLVVGVGISQAKEGKKLRKSEHEKKSPEERAKMKTERMTKKLELSGDQAAKIEALHLDFAKEEMKEREARKARRAAQEARIKEILNDDQNAKFEKLKEDRKEKGKRRRGKKREERKEKREMMKDEKSGDN